MQDIVIIGAGGVGREVAWIIEQINELKPTWNLLGFIDDNSNLHGAQINGHTVLGSIEYFKTMGSFVYAVCAIANYKVKKNIIDNFKNQNVCFARIIHPDVYVDITNVIGEDVIIYPGVIFTTNIRVGDHVIISPKCGIGHETVIEDYVSLLWNVNVSGKVIVGEGCLLGSGATVIQGINVGRECVIAAGAVVIRDTEPQGVYIGVPAKRKIK